MSDSILANLIDELFQCVNGVGNFFLGLLSWIARLTLASSAIVAGIGTYLWVTSGQGAGPILALLGLMLFSLTTVSVICYRRTKRSF